MTTRSQFAHDLLATAGWSASAEKVDALVAQASKENTTAVNNPLATTEPAPGATDFNPVGVKNYPSYEEGLSATLATFRNGHYPTLVAVLSAADGGSAATYCSSHDLDVWGTGNCTSYLAEIRHGDPNGYLTHQIAGGGPGPVNPPSPAPPPPVPTPAPIPGGTCTVELPIIQQGDNGWTVKAAQLILRGWDSSLVVDGDFGPLTRAAVVEVQRLGGVAQDGIVGPATWSLLLKGHV